MSLFVLFSTYRYTRLILFKDAPRISVGEVTLMPTCHEQEIKELAPCALITKSITGLEVMNIDRLARLRRLGIVVLSIFPNPHKITAFLEAGIPIYDTRCISRCLVVIKSENALKKVLSGSIKADAYLVTSNVVKEIGIDKLIEGLAKVLSPPRHRISARLYARLVYLLR